MLRDTLLVLSAPRSASRMPRAFDSLIVPLVCAALVKPRHAIVRLFAGGLLPLAASLPAGCGGESRRLVATRCGPHHDLRQAETAFTAAFCDLLVGCGMYADATACLESGDHLPPFFAQAASGCVTVDTDGLSRCIDRLREAECRAEAYFDATDVCLEAMRGTLPFGAECENDLECESHTCDEIWCGQACCRGTCAGRDAPEGSSCIADGDCAPGTYCATESATCLLLLPAGSPCDAARQCEDELGCHLGICQLLPREGERCDPNSLFACDAFRDHCDSTLARCVPESLLGERCSGQTQQSDCVGTAWCDAGICRPLPSSGDACIDGRCLGSLACEPESALCRPSNEPPQRCP